MRLLFLTLAILATFGSCKKNNSPGVASLNIIQAAVDLPPIYVYYTNDPSNFYLQQVPVTNFSYTEIGLPSELTNISIISALDTSKTLFQGSFDLKKGGIYSLYIAGYSSNIDTMFIKDNIPYYPDSSAGIRFINLAKGSHPISINLEGSSPEKMEFPSLSYKQVSSFKEYSTNDNGMYNFEIRDKENDSLLTTFPWFYTFHRCNTIIISNWSSPVAFQVNHF